MSRQVPRCRTVVFGLITVGAVFAPVLAGWGAGLKSAPDTRPAATTQPAPSATAAARVFSEDSYRLGVGDAVIVDILGAPALSGQFVVGSGGTIWLTAIGQVRLRGLSLAAARELITQKASKFVRRPQVTVTVDEAASVRSIYVSGEVERKGMLSLPFQANLADALAAATPTLAADLRRVRLTHTGQPPFEVDCRGFTEEGPLGTRQRLEHGDTVFVPRGTAQITVLGEVQAPGAIALPVGRKTTVLEAVRLALGFAAGADRSSAVILREGRGPVVVDLGRLLKQGAVAENRELQDGDVLVINRADSIAVVGQVHSPAVVDAPGGLSVLQALAGAGGPLPTGDLRRAQIVRGGTTIAVDLQSFIEQGKAPQEVALRPGDVLLVPAGEASNVLLTGSLSRPGAVELRGAGQRDLLRAVTTAGILPASDLSRVTVYRGEQTIVRNLEAVLKSGDRSQNLDLVGGDLVFVPSTTAGSVLLSGAVTQRGVIAIERTQSHDLLRIVTAAGPLPVADLSRVAVHRAGTVLVRDLKAALEAGKLEENLPAVDGDVIVVPESAETLIVTGAVQKGGVTRLLSAEERDLARVVVAAAPLDSADLTRVAVTRGAEKLIINVKRYLDGGDPAGTLTLRADDVVTVPSQEVQVFVSGAVGKPGPVRIPEAGMRDLARALTLAAPLTSADLSRVTVRRGDKTFVRNINAHAQTGRAEDTLELQEGDFVLVPSDECSVLITGAVTKGGAAQLVGPGQRDLLHAVIAAEPAPNANLAQVSVLRGGESLVRDLRQYSTKRDPAQALMLHDGDIVRVPAFTEAILVAGAAARTGVIGYAPGEQGNLAYVVMASGPTPTADLRRVRVYRAGKPTTFDVHAYLYASDKSQTTQLEPGDVVVIPYGGESALLTGALTHTGAVRVSETDERDLAQLVSAGVPLPAADLSRVVVYRGETQSVHDLSPLQRGGKLPGRIEVLPGDRVFVPGLAPMTVLVSGAVTRSGVVELLTPEQRDLAKVVVAAGPVGAADLSRVTVFRGSEPTLWNVKAYLEGKTSAAPFVLADGDRVLVPELGPAGVTIGGQVAHQGVVPDTPGAARDLLSVVTLAGPLEATADLSQVTVWREGQRMVRDLKRLREEADLSQNLQLVPGDVVYVPEATQTIVLMGEVAKPGMLNLHGVRQRDLARVMSGAGFSPGADLERVTIFRQGERLVSNYRHLMEQGDLTQNLVVEPGDIIYVPPDTTHDVMVMGAVARSGPVNVREETNRQVLKIVTTMGPTPAADLAKITIFRGDEQPRYANLQKLMDEGDMSQDLPVQPGDVIVVPKLGDLYVLGGVGKAGPLPVQPGWTVMDAIGAAGGTAHGGLERVTVLRSAADGTLQRIDIDFATVTRGRPPEPVAVKAGDIIYVPYPKSGRGLSWSTIRDGLFTLGGILNLFD